MENIVIHCYVTGLVQGVWFRAHTQAEAKRLGLTGWVKNLPDGRVEVLAAGDKNAISQLYAWLKKGPPKANVTNVEYEEVPWQTFTSFDIIQ